MSKISSACASIQLASDSRHHSAIGMSRWVRSTVWYLPATTAMRYGGSGGVVLKCQVFAAPRGSTRSTRPLPQTRHALGAVTLMVTPALRSG